MPENQVHPENSSSNINLENTYVPFNINENNNSNKRRKQSSSENKSNISAQNVDTTKR